MEAILSLVIVFILFHQFIFTDHGWFEIDDIMHHETITMFIFGVMVGLIVNYISCLFHASR